MSLYLARTRFLLCVTCLLTAAVQGGVMHLSPPSPWTAHPLDGVTVSKVPGITLIVRDGENRIYQRLPAAAQVTFIVGGSLGTHTIQALDKDHAVVDSLTFEVDA